MDDVQKGLLDQYDKLIEQLTELQTLKDSKAFQLWVSILKHIRTEALQEILANKGNKDELVGYAKCANYTLNFLETLAGEGAVALERKQQLLQEIRDAEILDAQNAARLRSSGYGTL